VHTLKETQKSADQMSREDLQEIAASLPALHAAPYPREDRTTRAPAASATAAVSSVLPLSTTMHSAISCQGISETTKPIDSASFSAGIMTEICGGILILYFESILNCSA